MKLEQALKLQARLVAIEYMIAHLVSHQYKVDGATPETIAQGHARLRGFAREWSFPELNDPAYSDLLASEIEAALDALLAKVEGVALQQYRS
jgi:hypothetical protein